MNIYKKIKTLYFLKKYNIKNYELIEDDEYGYIVNVNESVILFEKKIKSIDVKFNEIKGDFNCASNRLESLRGCPNIVHGNFFCNSNELISLEYGPKIIKGNFDCGNNQLKSLEGCPKIVKGNFFCNDNQLKELKGSPIKIQGYFNCSNNELISLKNGPEIVNGSFYIQNNNLSIDELIYLPKSVSKKIYIYSNQKLGDLQQIDDFNELKEKVDEIFKIKEEKENLLNNINKDYLKNNNVVNKI